MATCQGWAKGLQTNCQPSIRSPKRVEGKAKGGCTKRVRSNAFLSIYVTWSNLPFELEVGREGHQHGQAIIGGPCRVAHTRSLDSSTYGFVSVFL